MDAVLIAALDTIFGELLLAGPGALHDSPRRSRLVRARHIIGVGLSIILDDPRKATLLSVAGGGPAVLQAAFRQRIALVTDIILAEREAAELGFDRATALYVTSGTAQLIVAWIAGELDLDREGLTDKLAHLAVGAAGHRLS